MDAWRRNAAALTGYDLVQMTKSTHDETALITALRARDETAFAALVDLHTPSMLRVARGYVPNGAIAEEVVQETWIALIRGIDSFDPTGKPFDPHQHEAVMQEPSDKAAPMTVLQTFQRGYKIGDRVIRPAKVKVSK